MRESAPGERRGGRRRGTPNKATAEARALFRAMLEDLAPQVEKWIRKTAEEDPGKAADLTLKLAEFHIPKLQRLAIDLTNIPIEEILAELVRREAEEGATDEEIH